MLAPEPSHTTPLLPALALSALKTIRPLAPAAPPFAMRLGSAASTAERSVSVERWQRHEQCLAAARALAGRLRHHRRRADPREARTVRSSEIGIDSPQNFHLTLAQDELTPELQ